MSNEQSAKSPAPAWALWFFLGAFGAHRFLFFGKNNVAFAMLGAGVATVIAYNFIGAFAALPLLGWWVFDAFQVKQWLSSPQATDTAAASESHASSEFLHASPDTPPVAEFQDSPAVAPPASQSEAA